MRTVVLLAVISLAMPTKPVYAIICRQLLTNKKAALDQFRTNENKTKFGEFVNRIVANEGRSHWLNRIVEKHRYNELDRYDLATITGQQPILTFLRRIDDPTGIHHPIQILAQRCGLATTAWACIYTTLFPAGTPPLAFIGGLFSFNAAAFQLSGSTFEKYREEVFLEGVRNILTRNEAITPDTNSTLMYTRWWMDTKRIGLVFGIQDGEYTLHIVRWNEWHDRWHRQLYRKP